MYPNIPLPSSGVTGAYPPEVSQQPWATPSLPMFPAILANLATSSNLNAVK